MSDNYSKNPKRVLDAGLLPQITESNNNDDLYSDDNSAHGSSNSVSMSSADETSSNERKIFSCYDGINSEWMESAFEFDFDRVYVHGEILDWIVSRINENILDDEVRATVEEVFRHNLNGQVYLIKFHIKTTWEKFYLKRSTLLEYIEKLTYACVWEERPTYFLKIDSAFDERKDQIKSELRKLNLHDSFKSTSLDVNWLYIPKIEKYDFPEYLTDDQTNQIDLIFKNMSRSLSPLFICRQFEWHKDHVVGSYVDVDTLAMDICLEEWTRYDLLKEFDLKNLLDLDLAYKDYRNEFLNGYIEKYLNKLLLKLMPKLSSDNDELLVANLQRLREYARHYFVSKFYNKIIILEFEYHDKIFSKHDIPKQVETKMEVDLKYNKPTPDELSMMKHYSDIVYNISNYDYFSNSLFRTLLNKPNILQTYRISFGTDFQFKYEKHNKISSPLCQFKTLSIDLIDCTEKNAELLAIFMKYILNLCKDNQHRNAQIHITLTNCVLDDYSFLESIDRSVDNISFRYMNFTSSQVKLLSRFLTQQQMVFFEGCNITDSNLMTLLENIDLDDLDIGEDNACTPAVLFLIAEHLMNKESDRNPIHAVDFTNTSMLGVWKMFNNMNVDPFPIEFFNTGDQIIIRDIKSNKIKSLFRILRNKIRTMNHLILSTTYTMNKKLNI